MSDIYICSTNSDLTEGRGWVVPTVFTESRNVALWFANHYRPFYGRFQDISRQTIGDPITDWYGRSIAGEQGPRDPEENEAWKSYLALGEPTQPKLKKRKLYVVAILRELRIGDSRYPNTPFQHAVFSSYHAAVIVSERLSDDGTPNLVYEVQTDTYYSRTPISGEPYYMPMAQRPKLEPEQHEDDRKTEQAKLMNRFAGRTSC